MKFLATSVLLSLTLGLAAGYEKWPAAPFFAIKTDIGSVKWYPEARLFCFAYGPCDNGCAPPDGFRITYNGKPIAVSTVADIPENCVDAQSDPGISTSHPTKGLKLEVPNFQQRDISDHWTYSPN
ncbi:uncharacterized protein PFL1_05415 [Pseudozyma flocculosa PF-1]|uniref:Uncharacterized protein n=2 Tax=Pseudozyma flocculosa TaxID=84751 RepID=A0A5C3FD61_9BASI|nr:uncharacterized protein PFL1_05415 [Pseudozyma flocculosa PF-1]EPQ27134.1 hypothetical protein PFL1_05415 [Pseudozyma flocculosa PF-1]SPO41289.1 uncharacterized protein PSFLO_06771 [Pseudozyma flocculosa]